MTQPSPTDQAERNGQPATIDWPAVLAQHDHWLRTVVLARVGERQAVDEIMQEVSLAAVAQRSPLADPAKIAPWLYRVAVTQSLLYRRKRGRQRRLTERYAERVRPRVDDDRQPDPLGWLLAGERRQMLRRAMARLSGKDQELLLLKYTENWRYRDLASHLGVSESAVEARLHRARQRLRGELAALETADTRT